MNPAADQGSPQGAVSWPARLHRALMPDYNPKATAYWWTVVALGAAVLVHAGVSLADLTPQAWLQVSVGMAIAMLAGVFPVRIPHSKNSFAAGEIFIFLLLLIHDRVLQEIQRLLQSHL